MLSSFVTALALVASVPNVAAGPIHNSVMRHARRGYAQDSEILENYTGYHVRYLALNCHKQHNTQFFEDCCHPLLNWQKLSDRPAKCIPSASASSSAALVEPTSPPIDEDPIPDYDDDCEDESTSAPAPTTTQKSQPYTPPAEPTTSKVQSTSYKPSPTPEPTPEPTTSHKPSPQPSTTKTSSADPEPTKGSGGSEEITGGFATFFKQGGVAGACGKVHDDYEKVVALDYRRYGPLNQQSSDCGRTVLITNPKNGKTVTAKVADACPTCKNGNCLDLSLGAFDQIATREEGMVDITWHFVN